MANTRVSQERTFGKGLLVALGWGLAIGVAVVFSVNADAEKTGLLCFFVPITVLALVTSARVQEHRRYGFGMLLGTVAAVPLIGLMVSLWAIWDGALAG